METQRLRHLCVVVETGGLREASRLLGISHSGLSKSLRLLEQELGVALLVRFAVDMLESALDLARRGIGVLYVPTFVAALHNRMTDKAHALQRLPTPKEAHLKKRDVFLVKRRAAAESEDMKKIAKALREICRLDV
jgi:DNA-binding transcriptional LysR family regulator